MRIAVTEINQDALLRQLLDAIPSYVFLVDNDVSILDYNSAAAGLLGLGKQEVLRRRGGDVLHCVHSRDVAEGCGYGPFCKSCPVRSAVTQAFAGGQCIRKRVQMELLRDLRTEELDLLVTASPFDYNGYRLVVLILEEIRSPAEKSECGLSA